MKQFDNEWQRIKRAMKQAFVDISIARYKTVDINIDALERFREAMDDDFNISNVMTVVYDQLKAMNRSKEVTEIARFYHTITLILSILGIRMDLMPLSDEQIERYQAWQQARAEKRYSDADRIRMELVDLGLL